MIVFVAEKPSVVRALAQTAFRSFPEQALHAISAPPYGVTAFRYGRGDRWEEFPRTDLVRSAVRPDAALSLYNLTEAGAFRTDPDDVRQAVAGVLADARQIVFACDPDPTGAVSFHTLLSCTVGYERANRTHARLLLHGLNATEVAAAFERMGTTEDEQFQSWLRYGEVKRYFDFNFNMNSNVILGRTVEKVCHRRAVVAVSKYALQLLYFLAASEPINESLLMRAMSVWRGTGRYHAADGQRGLGSAGSRAQIVLDLARNGFVEFSKAPGDAQGQLVTVTPLGKAFVNALHPDCRDLDLPFRLHQWCSEGMAMSGTRINRYIRTFFGKQKDFLAS